MNIAGKQQDAVNRKMALQSTATPVHIGCQIAKIPTEKQLFRLLISRGINDDLC